MPFILVTATNLLMGYKAILYGPIARNNLKTALRKINTYVRYTEGKNVDTGSRAGHDVQHKLEPLKNHTLIFIPGAYSCQFGSSILDRCIALRERSY